MIDKDEVGQTLIPEDIILEDETSGFLACKATGDGDCLFHSAKSEKKESLQKRGPEKTPSSQRRFIRRIFWGESSLVRSQWRLISELIQLFQLLSVINTEQLRQWNRLFSWILNFALSLGISFVRPDCFLVRQGLVSDLTSDLLMKKNYLWPCYTVSHGEYQIKFLYE